MARRFLVVCLVLLLAFVASTVQAQTPEPTRERIVLEPLTVTPPSGPIGTNHLITSDGLAPGTSYRLVVVFRETDEVVFEESYTTDGAGILTATLFSEPGDRLGEYNIDVYDQDNALVRTGLMTITEGTLAPPQTEALVIAAGETVTGQLTFDTARHLYIYSGLAGEVVNITLVSDAFDAYLALYGPDTQLLTQNDDGAGDRNAEIRAFTLPADGDYTIAVTSRGAAESNGSETAEGEYTLTLNVARRADSGEADTISDGEIIVGALTPEVQTAQYTFTASQGAVVTIALDADDFDPYVRLNDESGSQLIGDDDGGPGLYALIENYTIPRDGQYTIVIDGYRGFTGDRIIEGEYRLTLEIEGSSDVVVQPTVQPTQPDTTTQPTHVPTTTTGTDGTTIEGTLGGDVQTGTHTFEGNQGDPVSIAVNSSDFDPLVRLLAPDGTELITDDDSGGQLNALIDSFELPETGLYTVVVDGYRGVSGDRPLEGSYTLTISTGGAGVVQQPTTLPTIAPTLALTEGSTQPPAQGDGTIAYGQTVDGTLGGDVQTGVYTFSGSQGDVISVSLTSEAFDPLVRLLDADGFELISDDDSGEGLNSLIQDFQLPDTGTYSIVVDGYRGAGGDLPLEGAYTVSLQMDEGGVVQQPTIAPTLAPTEGSTPQPSQGDGTIAYDQTIEGELGGDVQAASYTFSGSQGDVVTISLTSDAFDPLVRLLDSDSNELTSDDDNGEGLNALIENYALPADGVYTVIVDGYRGMSGEDMLNGTYSLTLQAEGADIVQQPTTQAPTLVPTNQAPTGDDTIASGQTITGELTEDEVDGDSYTFTADQGAVVTITLNAAEFDPIVQLFINGTELTSDDDGGDSLNSLIAGYELPASGQFTIVVNGFRGFDGSQTVVGEYELTLEIEGETVVIQPDSTPVPSTTTGGTINYGDQVQATLNGGGTSYTFEGNSGDVITASVTAEVDTVLVLLGPDGQELFSDDDGGEGFNPEISEFVLPAAGQYTLQIQPYAGAISGNVSLVLKEVTGVLTEESQTISLSDKSPVKVLTFDVQAGENLRLIVSELTDSEGTPVITVTQNDTLLAESPIGFVERLTFDFTVPESGTIDVKISYQDSGSAVLEVSVERP